MSSTQHYQLGNDSPQMIQHITREKSSDSVNGEWLLDDRDEEKIGTGYNLIDC